MTTIALTALSIVPDLLVGATTASRATLILAHLVAAAIVIPTVAARLPSATARPARRPSAASSPDPTVDEEASGVLAFGRASGKVSTTRSCEATASAWRPADERPPPSSHGPYGGQPQPGSGNGWAVFGGFILGTGGYVCLNVALFSFILTPHAPGADEVSPMRAVLLALVALGGGLLCLKGSYLAKGIGLGMIVGWSLVSILTQGTCTGLDPEIYKNSEATSAVSH